MRWKYLSEFYSLLSTLTRDVLNFRCELFYRLLFNVNLNALLCQEKQVQDITKIVPKYFCQKMIFLRGGSKATFLGGSVLSFGHCRCP